MLDEFRKSLVDDKKALLNEMASEYKLNLVKKMKVLAAFEKLNKWTPSLDAPSPTPPPFTKKLNMHWVLQCLQGSIPIDKVIKTAHS